MTIKKEFALFSMAGGIGFLVDYLVVLVLSVLFAVHPMVARIFSFICAVYTTWLLNSRVTFAERIAEGSRQGGFYAYVAAMLLGLAVNYATYGVCLLLVSGVYEPVKLLIAVACGSVAGLGVNFFSCHKVLFKREEEK